MSEEHDAATKTGRGARRALVAGWALLALAAIYLGRQIVVDASEYEAIHRSGRGAVVALRWIAVLVTLGSAVFAAARWRRLRSFPARGARVGLALRTLLYLVLPALTAGSIAYASGFEGEMQAVRSVFFSTYLLGGGLWMALVAAYPERLLRPPAGPLRVMEVVAVNVLAVLVVAETAVSLYATWFPSALLWNEGSVVSRIEANRLPPGTLMFDFPANSGGYHDTEFFRASGDDFVVALLADSFGLGVVPYRYNFATVAERILQEELQTPGRRVAVHNFGIGAIGMPEYAWLLEHEVGSWNPSLIVLAVFVGNDIDGFNALNRRFYCFQNFYLSQFLLRLLRVSREGAEAGALPGPAPAAPGKAPGTSGYTPDPEKEIPRFSETTYLQVEGERMEIVNARSWRSARRWRGFFSALGSIREKAGDRLRVMVIPDEFQVNDDLWAELLRRTADPEAYERDLPQERILAYCREQGIPVLDLLPALRAGQRQGRVYHLRDTHWNAAGNAIAGRELARFLLDHR